MPEQFLRQLTTQLRKFSAERDWDQFHSPKNLTMALVGEVGELTEHFQWLTEEQSSHLSQEVQDEIALEMADVLIYLIRLADKLNIDLNDATVKKMTINEKKYPAEQVKGSAKKYTFYQN